MAPQRRDQNPHAGQRVRPKLTTVGRFTGRLNGAAFTLEAVGPTIVLRFGLSPVTLIRLWSARKARPLKLPRSLGVDVTAFAGPFRISKQRL